MKRKYSYIGLSLVILIFGIIFIPKIVDRLGRGEVVSPDKLKENYRNSKTSQVSYITIDGEKKKAPQFKLVDQNGDTISNKDYLGKVYVAEFFFTTCPSICPIMNKNLVEVQNELKDKEDFGIASFSIDPAHDTPKVLRAYAEEYGITNPNWHLLTGDKDSIYHLANKGFKVFAGEDASAPGGFAHSGMMILVDKEGYLRCREDKYGNPILYYRGFVPRNKTVTEEEEEPQINMLIEDIKKLL